MNNKNLIVVNQSDSQQKSTGKDESSKFGFYFGNSKNSTSAQNSLLENSPFSLGLTFEAVDKNHDKWQKDNYSSLQQLNDLNWASRDEIKWAQEGLKIVPKSLNVAVLNRASLQRDIQLSYRKQYIKDAAYKKAMSIPTDVYVPAVDIVDELYRTINATVKNMLDRLYREANKTEDRIKSIMRHQESVIKSYKIACHEISSLKDERQYDGDPEAYIAYKYNANVKFYLDRLSCKSFDEDYFIQSMELGCKSIQYTVCWEPYLTPVFGLGSRHANQ
uniref:Uncharacterized protein n=1 Tax=Romanomermis culicivorax TaxID=13658 RepID=A0A915JD59_ROMCU